MTIKSLILTPLNIDSYLSKKAQENLKKHNYELLYDENGNTYYQSDNDPNIYAIGDTDDLNEWLERKE